MKESIELIIKGRVQGIGFRAFTAVQAERFDVCGWVSNLSNGDVKVIAQGKKNDLADFVAKLKKGPLYSSVQSIVETQIIPAEQYDDFSIRY